MRSFDGKKMLTHGSHFVFIDRRLRGEALSLPSAVNVIVPEMDQISVTGWWNKK